jgi:hypothetical protein
VSKIISVYQQTLTAGEIALLLDEEAVVSRIIAQSVEKPKGMVVRNEK